MLRATSKLKAETLGLEPSFDSADQSLGSATSPAVTPNLKPAVNCQPSYRGRALSTEPHAIKTFNFNYFCVYHYVKNIKNMHLIQDSPRKCIFQSKIQKKKNLHLSLYFLTQFSNFDARINIF